MTPGPTPRLSRQAVVAGAFDNPRSRDLRFLQEASRTGQVTVLLWDDESVGAATGRPPQFTFAEREYFLKAVRYVGRVVPVSAPDRAGVLPMAENFRGCVWLDTASSADSTTRAFSRQHGLDYRVIAEEELRGFPEEPPSPASSNRKKVVVTGCYDWLHSGHVRFFEEVSSYGDLYVIVGHDENIRLLKGPGHPLLPQAERRFQVGCVRFVTQALISSGNGWLDADPEIRRLKPDIYAVNEDGDRGGKREYCAQLGIEYLVLKRVPAPGLPPRSSTELRGF